MITLARVFGFVAAEADVCVLLREGPGKHTLMIRWDLETDELQIGQWLVSWVSDGALSADGRLFLYHGAKRNAGSRDSYHHWLDYNVVCRPPFFTALAYWQESSGTERLRWSDRSARPIRSPLKGTVPDEYRSRLALEVRSLSGSVAVEPPFRTVGQSKSGELVLYRDRSHPDFYSLDEELLEADWADVDHRGRVLFTRGGHVFVLDENGERELIDLTPLAFETVKPPAWARNWPRE